MLYIAFTMGLMGSLHCVGMCSPITLILPYTKKKPLQVFLYFLGKSTTYVILGALFGLVGKGLFIGEYQQLLSVVTGVVMIANALAWIGEVKLLNTSGFFSSLFVELKNMFSKYIRKGGYMSFLAIGLLNGLLPCGLLYMTLFSALSAGTIAQTCLYMLFFALGTMPIMILTIYVGDVLSKSVKLNVNKIIPVFIILVGSLFIVRGLGLNIHMVSPGEQNLIIKEQADCR